MHSRVERWCCEGLDRIDQSSQRDVRRVAGLNQEESGRVVVSTVPSLLDAIIIVRPETAVGWHRRGFRACWRWKSWRRGGRPRIDRKVRELIRRMSRENPLWGAPRIHGELPKLGIEVSESTVGRHMAGTPRVLSQGWKASSAIKRQGSLPSTCSWSAPSCSSCSMI